MNDRDTPVPLGNSKGLEIPPGTGDKAQPQLEWRPGEVEGRRPP